MVSVMGGRTRTVSGVALSLVSQACARTEHHVRNLCDGEKTQDCTDPHVKLIFEYFI